MFFFYLFINLFIYLFFVGGGGVTSTLEIVLFVFKH